jgi:hypothetical protein
VDDFPEEAQQWVVQPLLDAGVELPQVCELVFQLAFDGIATAGRATVAGLGDLVADRPPEVRSAWAQMISRMLLLELAP